MWASSVMIGTMMRRWTTFICFARKQVCCPASSMQRHSTMKKRASGDVGSSYIDHLSCLVTFKAANATYGCSSPKQLLNVRGSRPLFAPQRDFISIWVFKMSKSLSGVLFNRDWRQSPLANFRDIAVVIINSKYDRHTCRTSVRGILTFWVNSEEKMVPRVC